MSLDLVGRLLIGYFGLCELTLGYENRYIANAI
jgi:hypothetical protein